MSATLLSLSLLQPFARVAPMASAQESMESVVDQSSQTNEPLLNAQDAHSDAIASITDTTPMPTPTPQIAVVPSPTEDPSPTTSPTETIASTPSTQPTPTESEPHKEISPPPADQNVTSPNSSDQGQILDGISTTATPTPTPSVTATQPAEGKLETVILKNVEAVSLDLDSIDPSASASLTSDKADYAPTDTALISGSGLSPNTSYTLTVSSTDDPATSTTVEVMTSSDGSFSYAYQLDGNYRPNYSVKLKNEAGQVVVAMSFTDGAPILSVTVAGTGTGSVISADGFINCSSGTCTHTYGGNFSTVLTESPTGGSSTFVGWTGGCTGVSSTCTASATGNNTFSATATFNLSDTTAPTVSTVDSDGQTYSTSTASPHSIKVTFSENIANTPTVSVSGSSQTVTNCGDADAKTFCFAYPIPSATAAVTKTITISGAQDSATNTMLADSSHTFIVDTKAPTLSPVHIQSNNANTAVARVGDVVTVSFTASESVTGTSVTIAGQSAALSGSGTGPYSATFTMTSGQSNGALSFAISGFKDTANNVGTTVTATTDASVVTFDKTSPVITIANPTTAPAQSKTITASTDEGTLTQSITTGSLCDGTLTYTSYSSTTFTSESDNGKKVCYKAIDTAGNTTYSLSSAIAGIDTTKPVTTIVGATDGNSNTVTSGGLTKSNSLSVSFNASDTSGIAGSECQLDSGSYSACTTPKLYSGLSDGGHTINIRSTDNAGNVESTATFAWTVDTTAPNLSTKMTYSGWYTSNQTSTFTYADTNGIASGTPVTCTISTEGTAQTCSVTPNVCDNAGNCNTTLVTSNGADIDKTAPTSTIDTPTNTGSGSTLYTNSWNGSLAGGTSDGTSGITKVWLSIHRASDDTYWNGVSWSVGTEATVRVQTTGTTAWTYALPTPLDDTYVVKSHAQDTAGNLEDSYTLTIVLDQVNPTVSLAIDPTTGDASNGWYKTEPTVSLSAADNILLDRIEYQYDSTTGTWTTYAAPFKTPGEGAHVLYYRSWDKAGNVSTQYSKDIKYDKTTPSKGPQNLSVSPNPSNGDNVKVKWEAATDNVGIDHYSVSWKKDGVNERGADVSVTTREYTITDSLTEGSWTVKVVAYDAAGFSAEASTTATVDKTGPTAPTLTLTGTGTGTVSVSWNTVSDAVDYSVWYGVTPGIYLYAAHIGNVTSYTISGLASQTYYAVVAAYDSTGNRGGFSNEVSTGTTITGVPGAGVGPATGFAPASEVLGAATPSAEPAATPSETNLDATTTPKPRVIPWWFIFTTTSGTPVAMLFWAVWLFW